MSEINLSMAADECGIETVQRMRFFGQDAKEILCGMTKLQVSKSVDASDVLDILYEIIPEGKARAYQHRGCCLEGTYKDGLVFVEMWTGETNHPSRWRYEDEEDFESCKEIMVYIYGNRHAIKDIPALLDKRFERQIMAKIQWWHGGEGRGPSQRTLYLPPLKTHLHPEFYPGMPDPSKFLKDYLKSDASILLMAGPPGTGKTTLLRHLVCENKLTAHVVYDETLMRNDTVFQSFLFGEGDIMIIEDADLLITSREQDQNKLMSRFLNVSDGLIKLPSKKLVFTTNISDFNKVDPALVRAGRCFDVVHTRPLNLTEAQAAAKVAGLPIPVEKGEYTLADLFNDGPKHKARTIGFVA